MYESEAIPGIRLEPWMRNPGSMTATAGEGPDGPQPALNADGSILDNLDRSNDTREP